MFLGHGVGFGKRNSLGLRRPHGRNQPVTGASIDLALSDRFCPVPLGRTSYSVAQFAYPRRSAPGSRAAIDLFSLLRIARMQRLVCDEGL